MIRMGGRPASAVAGAVAICPESELVALARHGDTEAFRVIIGRTNRQLFRATLGILRDNAEAEDAVQEAYFHAFQSLGSFRGECKLSTWLMRIALNEALRRRHTMATVESLDAIPLGRRDALIVQAARTSSGGCADPESTAIRSEFRRLLNEAIEELPEPFRLVLVLRSVEGASVEETAARLGLRQGTVRTRLHRARRLLRAALDDRGQEEASALPDQFSGAAAILRPPIILSAPDHKRLIVLAGAVAGRSPQVARLLMEETSRAQVVAAERLPRGIVAIGSLVKFRDATSHVTQRVQLALPTAVSIGKGGISALSLVGAGLVGLAAGQSIDWPTQGGRMRRLSVLSVDPGAQSTAAPLAF